MQKFCSEINTNREIYKTNSGSFIGNKKYTVESLKGNTNVPFEISVDKLLKLAKEKNEPKEESIEEFRNLNNELIKQVGEFVTNFEKFKEINKHIIRMKENEHKEFTDKIQQENENSSEPEHEIDGEESDEKKLGAVIDSEKADSLEEQEKETEELNKKKDCFLKYMENMKNILKKRKQIYDEIASCFEGLMYIKDTEYLPLSAIEYAISDLEENTKKK